MSLIIELPADEATALEAKARAQGMSPEQYVRRVIEMDLAPDWLRQSWESAERAGTADLSMDEIEAEIAAARRARR